MMRRSFLVSTVLFAVGASLPSAFLRADPAPDYSGPEWRLLEPGPELRAAAEVTPGAFPNCDTVTVDERVFETYRPDGTAQNQDESYVKVLTEKGRRENAVLTQGFILPYFTTDVPRLEIIRPDGKVVPVDVAANASESIDESQMEENIYDPNTRVLKVNVPGLEVGDVLHSIVRTTTRRPIIARAFSDQFLLEGPQYIRHMSCEIRSPAGAPLRRIALRDPVGTTVRHTRSVGADGSADDLWVIAGVPRMYDEPAMPAYAMVLQRLLVSTLPDWPAVSRWYWDLSQSHLAAVSAPMSAEVARLTAGAADDRDRIERIFFYVSQNIRYMGVTPEHDRPGFEPHDVDLTFAKKYGVCRDKAALLVALLRMAGEKAYPVLINVGCKLDPEVPSPDFDHAIVAVETAPDHYLLMDPTDEHTRTLLPAYDGNQSYLVCRPEGDVLRTSPVEPPEENLVRIRTTGRFSDDGSLSATCTLRFGGINDDLYRGALVQMTPEKRLRFFQSRLRRALAGARVTSLRISPANLFDTSVPLEVEIGVTSGAMAAFGRGQAILTLPWLGRHFGLVDYILKDASLDRRKYPMITFSTCGVEERFSLDLGKAFGQPLSLPLNSSLRSGGLTYGRTFGLDGRTLRGAGELTLNTVEFSPRQYLALKRGMAKAWSDDRRAPIMAVAGPPPAAPAVTPALAAPPRGADADILEDRQELTANPSGDTVLRVTYVKRVLTYAGKISESEIKIPYNPATQSVRLLQAYVVSPSGQRQEASLDEVNSMDAGWNSSAKRYTGGKILVDSLPGVEVGSTIHVEYELSTHGQPYSSGFQAFQLTEPIEAKSFRLVAPAGLPVQIRTSGPPGLLRHTDSVRDGRRVLEWTARDVAALPEESETPPAWDYQAGVSYFLGDPAAALARVSQALRDLGAPAPEIRARVGRLTARASSPLGKLRAIRDYIAQNVRLAGPSFTELPLRELSPAVTTLEEGYGHLADRAILYRAMLAAAGFSPDIVLASDIPPAGELARIGRSVPLLPSFDTPLVRVRIGGAAYYFNDTDQYAPLGATPHDQRLGIDLADGLYQTIRALPDDRAREATLYRITLGDNGRATIAVKREFYGTSFAAENRDFTEMRPEERDRRFQQIVSQLAEGARPVGTLATDFHRYPGTEEFTVEVPHFGIAEGRFYYFDLPFTPRFIPTPTDGRSLPLLNKDNRDTITRVEVGLPAEYPQLLISPRTETLAEPAHAGFAEITTASGPGQWSVTYRMHREPAVIPADAYPAALSIESSLEARASREILLGPAPERADARPAGSPPGA